MQAIGERLLEARMRQGLDISEIERATKIRAKYLRALEREDFAVLPGPTFVKTFLRTYADHLGLDATLLVEGYRAEHESREPEVQPFVAARGPERRRRPGRTPRPSGPPGPGTAVLVAVAVVLLIFAILGLTQGTGKNSASTPAPARHPVTAKRPARTRPPATPKRAAPTSVALRIVPVGPTYVCVDRGARTPIVFESIISAPQAFHGRHLRVTSGKASVGLIVNNRRLSIPASGQPVGYDLTPTGSHAIPPPERPCVTRP